MASMAFLAEIAGKGTLILAAAWFAAALLRRRSASLRHFIWTAAFTALLALPIALRVIPRWSPVATAAPPSQTVVAVVTRAPQPNVSTPAPTQGRTWNPALIWLLGCALASARFLIGAVRTSWMVHHSRDAGHAQALLDEVRGALGIRRPVRVLESSAVPMPLTWGIFRPVVVLPEDAPAWPAARLNTVLLHELSHVQRLDLAAQTLAQAACCLFWFHPLAWLALRELRKERERACDDAVLLRGIAAHDYAGHLMDLVRALAARRSAFADAPAMAEASDLESRVRAMLDRGRSRGPLTLRMALAVAGAVVAILGPVAAFTAHAQAAGGSISGVVKDPSGARIPGTRVTARNLDGSNSEVTMVNPAGEYRFDSIPPGRYALEFMVPGFKVNKQELSLVAGAVARADANLELGARSEVVTITGTKPGAGAAPLQQPASDTQRVKIGGSVQPARLVRQTRPAYPDELKALGITGTVVVRAIISKNGSVLNPTVVNTVDQRLAKLALDAVSQWSYEPTLLNGEPVEILTDIDVVFQLSQ